MNQDHNHDKMLLASRFIHHTASMLERVYRIAEQTDPKIAQGLRRIHDEEKRHRAEILEMLMKSDPQAALVGNVFADSVAGT